MKQARKYFLLALAIIVVDQIVKLIVKFNMEKGIQGQIKVLGDVFKIHFIENKGAAFGLTITNLFNGMGMDMSDETGKLILSLFSIAAVIAIGVVLYRLADHQSPLPWFVASIFGGALGNIIDRTFYGVWFSEMNDYQGGLFHGQVVDMFYLDIWEGQIPNWVPLFGGDYTSLWPIFNIADAAISIGIVVVLFAQNRFFNMHEAAMASQSSSTAPEKSTDSATTTQSEDDDPA